jgi:transcriptional regulator with XRE-family HTH domain
VENDRPQLKETVMFDTAAQAIGLRIKSIREDQGYSQPELARTAGISVRNIQAWEQGVNEPLASSLILLARALDVTSDEILGLKREIEEV